ncbi:MAG: bis(5'-nucleosyl)-tetraphosphatase (symmetrical) YqeK [bacterium]|nr:bis(5'-nucleosyl)-tetraphosphatase (symmetrical) YqeK [bacterium]
MEDNVRELCAYLKKTLKPSRYEHTIGVAYTAANMAMRYGEDVKRAFLAGVLHDNAKNVSDDELLEFCEKNKIEVREIERTSKYLLHAKVGAYHVKNTFHIEDPEIASAVCYHTTGKPNMTLLEKIIFTADYIEPNRREIPGLAEVREMVYKDLDQTVYLIAKNTLHYLRSNKNDANIDPLTLETYEYYKNLCGR